MSHDDLHLLHQNISKLTTLQKALLITSIISRPSQNKAETLSQWKSIFNTIQGKVSSIHDDISKVAKEVNELTGLSLMHHYNDPIPSKYLFNLLQLLTFDKDYKKYRPFLNNLQQNTWRYSHFYQMRYPHFKVAFMLAELNAYGFDEIKQFITYETEEQLAQILAVNGIAFPPERKWFSELTLENQLDFMETVLCANILRNTALHPLFWEYAENLSKVGKGQVKTHNFYYYFAQYSLIRGEAEPISNVLSRIPEHRRIITEAVLLCMGGKYKEADGLFVKGFRMWRKENKRKAIPFASPFGLVYAFSLLVNHEDDFIKKFKRISKKHCGFYVESFDHLKHVLPTLVTRDPHQFQISKKFSFITTTFLNWVIKYLAIELPERTPKIIYRDLETFLLEGEHFWYLAEILDNPLIKMNKLRAIERQSDFKLPIPEKYIGTPKWEIWLDSLEKTLEKQSQAQAETRVVWKVDIGREEIRPYEQKKSKTGKWSRGRPISLSKLKDGEYELKNEADARLLPALKEDGWHYNQYEFDYPNALFLLAGNKNVFVKDKHITPLEIKLVQPSLNLKRYNNGSYKIELIPVTEHPIHFKYVSYNQVEVTRFDDKIYALGTVLSNTEGKFPDEAFSRLVDWLKKAQKIVKVSGDLPVELMEDLPSIQADSKLLIKIVPNDDGGFIGECHLKPTPPLTRLLTPAQGFEKFTEEIEDEVYCIHRNFAREKKHLEKVQSLAETLDINYDRDQNTLNFPSELEMLRFLESGQILVENKTVEIEVLKDENNKIISYLKPTALQLSLNSSSGWLNLVGDDIEIDDQLSVKFADLLSFSRQDETNFFKLSDKDYVLISQSLKRKMRQLSFVSSPKEDEVQIHPIAALYLESVVEDGQIQANKGKGWTRKVNELKKIEEIGYAIPENLMAKLRHYQYEGFQWLCRRAEQKLGACLADDMGLGKTVQSIAVLLHRSELGPALIIAPTSVCANWQSELARFAPDLNTFNLYEETGEDLIPNLSSGDVLICSYGLLTNRIEFIEKVHFASAILDEAQAIKNPDAKRSKAAFRIQADAKWVTTGTPIENRLQELWSIFRFINPGLLGSLQLFRERFVIPIENHENQWVASQLRTIVQPFLLRRTKNEVLTDLPPKTEINRQVLLSKAEITFYETLRIKAKEELADSSSLPPGQRQIKIFSILTKLRLAACSPALVDPELDMQSSKLEALQELLDEILPVGHQVLIFSQFVKHLKIIQAQLDHHHIPYYYLDGSTAPKNRKKLIRQFEDGKCAVFLLSLKAGGTGINLTSASYVIHMDPWWNPAVEDQATDRAHRIGQNKSVTVYRLLAKNTIEEKINELHQSKRALADQIISEQSTSKLDLEEMVEMLFS